MAAGDVPGNTFNNDFNGNESDEKNWSKTNNGWHNNYTGANVPDPNHVSFPWMEAAKRYAAETPAAPAAPAATPAAPVKPMEGDLALNKKMQGETYFDTHKDQWTQPTMAEGQAKTAIDKHAGAAPVANGNSAKMFGMWENLAPADMSGYYANAGRQGSEALGKSMAARGSYGSSAMNDQESEMFGNLAADRAKAEAQYGLQRTQVGAGIAGQADNAAIAGSADDRAWTLGLGNLAQGADAGKLAGLNAGMNASMGAENSGINRINSLFGATDKVAGQKAGIIGDVNSSIASNDKDLFGSGVAAGVAPYSEGAAAALTNRAQSDSDREASIKNAAALAKLFKDK